MTKILLLIGILLLVLLSGSGNLPARADTTVCDHNPLVADLLSETDQTRWLDWIEKLSGAEPARIAGLGTWIQTRETRFMFNDQPNARAYDFVLEQTRNWYPESNITQHEYDIFDITAKNLIVTIPGISVPEEVVLLSAHLDSIALGSDLAPGANDNGTGSATLLEAARTLRRYRFDRTIQLVWFSGEEDGLIGSRVFVKDHAAINYVGVINMDMFGWDSDGDRCFNISADSDNTGSQMITTCFDDIITAYNLDLQPELVDVGRSDHVPFQEAGIGAIGIHEYISDDRENDSCSGTDKNPNSHSIKDTVDQNLTPDYGFAIAQAGLSTVMELAQPLAACFTGDIQLAVSGEPPGTVQLDWNTISGADGYRVFRSSFGCGGSWQVVAQTAEPGWQDGQVIEDWPYQYQVEAVAGVCVSRPSNCVSVGPDPPPVYELIFLPIIY